MDPVLTTALDSNHESTAWSHPVRPTLCPHPCTDPTPDLSSFRGSDLAHPKGQSQEPLWPPGILIHSSLIFKCYLKAPLSLESRQRHCAGDSDLGSVGQGEKQLPWTLRDYDDLLNREHEGFRGGTKGVIQHQLVESLQHRQAQRVLEPRQM